MRYRKARHVQERAEDLSAAYMRSIASDFSRLLCRIEQ